jgi:hypothetical protein
VLEQFPKIITAVDCHPFGKAIYRPQPTKGTFTPFEPVTKEYKRIYVRLESSMNSLFLRSAPLRCIVQEAPVTTPEPLMNIFILLVIFMGSI